MKCAKCGFDNPASMKFCGQCGISLIAVPCKRMEIAKSVLPKTLRSKILATKIQGERRNVTVLFADVSGYTALSEKLDPEEVRELLNGLFKVLVKVVYKYEGTIDKFIGDCIMALFGAPLAHEDDPERAVHVALEIMNAVRRFNEERGTELAIHIGINSGMVVAGGVGSDLRMDYTVVGDTVNLASRLMDVAKNGKILISESVHRIVEYLFEVEELRSVKVKGKAEKVKLYRVVGVKEVPQRKRGIAELSSPLVGRDEEFAMLRSVIERVVEGKAEVVSLIGEAGIGKSRLIMEMKQHLDGQVAWLGGKCFSYGKTVPFLGFLEQLRSYFGVNELDPESECRKKLESRARRLFGNKTDEYLAYLCSFLSIEVPMRLQNKVMHLGPEALRLEQFISIKILFKKIAKKGPLVLYFEDMHWIDQESLDLILFLFDALKSEPIIFIFETRPEKDSGLYEILKPIKKVFKKHYTKIRLQPLNTNDVNVLLQSLLRISDVPEHLSRLIIEKSEGNPFYIEEIIRSFIDLGALKRKGDLWYFASEVSSFGIPDTIEAVIRSRIDRIDATEKEVLGCAAVIGRKFHYRILVAISSVKQIKDTLEILESDMFITRVSTSEYMFRHILIRDVVYHGLLRRQRREIHKKIAECMENIFRGKIEEYYKVIAYHYHYADLLAKSFEYYNKAGDLAKKLYHNDVAIECYTRAIEISGKILYKLAELLEKRGDAQASKADYENALVDYKDAYCHYKNVEKKANINRKIGEIYFYKGEYKKAISYYEGAIDLLGKTFSSPVIWETYLDYAWLLCVGKGEFHEAAMRTQKIVTNKGVKQDARIYAYALNIMGNISYYRGDYNKALKYNQKALSIYETLDNKTRIAEVSRSIGVLYKAMGDFDAALRHYKNSLSISEQIGDKRNIGIAFNNIGNLYRAGGKYAIALRNFKKYLSISEEIGDKRGIGIAYLNIGVVYGQKGEYDTALRYFEGQYNISKELGDKSGVGFVYENIGSIYFYRGELGKANEYFDKCIAIFKEIGYKAELGSVYLKAGVLYRETEKFNEATDYFRKAEKIFKKIGNRPLLSDAYTRLSESNVLRGNYKTALRYAKKALSLAKETGIKEKTIIALRAMGQVLSKNNPKKAIIYLRQAITYAKKEGMKYELATSLYEMARILRILGKEKEAKKNLREARILFTKMGAIGWLKKIDRLLRKKSI